jgi:hypothetical protein
LSAPTPERCQQSSDSILTTVSSSVAARAD